MIKKKIFFTAIYIVFVLLILEVWARGYYVAKRHLGFFITANDMVYNWYPELRKVKDYRYEPGQLNMLLLGGSVLTNKWGNVEESLKEASRRILGKEANILNLAESAQGTPDGFYKYTWITGKRFDDVLVYYGINEARANNIPSRLFRKDYSHYAWYEEIHFYFRHPFLRKTPFVLPYFAKHLAVQLKKEVLFRKRYAPENSPRAEWLKYGGDIKTKQSFRENLLRIINAAKERNDELIIPTFAFYKIKPQDDATGGPDMKFTEIWGDYANVAAGIEAHDDVVRELAGSGGFKFIDIQKAMDNEKAYFIDICHFTEKGSALYAKSVISAIRQAKFPLT